MTYEDFIEVILKDPNFELVYKNKPGREYCFKEKDSLFHLELFRSLPKNIIWFGIYKDSIISKEIQVFSLADNLDILPKNLKNLILYNLEFFTASKDLYKK